MPSHFYKLQITGLLFSVPLMLLLSVRSQAQSDWPQWGGPGRNFVSTSKGLAASWPQTGPKQLWTRPLGEGHSAILVDGNTLYTMYSQGEQEVGHRARREHRAKPSGSTNTMRRPPAVNYEEGLGPHSTPLLVGDLTLHRWRDRKASCAG